MMTRFALLATGTTLGLLSSAAVPARSAWSCSPQDAAAQLRVDDPAYKSAMELTQTLEARGFEVDCVCQSKSIHMFEGQTGAAVFRTDRGDFEALFLSKTETFAVQPTEQRKDGRFIYSFSGNPPAKVARLDGSHPIYFVQHTNTLFMVYIERVAATLDKAVNSNSADNKSR
jgi:hypothetical protein